MCRTKYWITIEPYVNLCSILQEHSWSDTCSCNMVVDMQMYSVNVKPALLSYYINIRAASSGLKLPSAAHYDCNNGGNVVLHATTQKNGHPCNTWVEWVTRAACQQIRSITSICSKGAHVRGLSKLG